MQNNILFSGFSYSKENFELMKNRLENNGIPNVVDFGPYNVYENMEDEELISLLCENFDKLGDNTNIICHSMGCNLGLILAKERSSKIKKAVFLSPELQKTTRREKRVAKLRILHGLTPTNDFSVERPVNMGILAKLKLYKVFKQTQKLALESLDNMPKIDSLVIYGIADKFVSHAGAEELIHVLDAHSVQAWTSQHNILLSGIGDRTAEDISKFLNGELLENLSTGYQKIMK